MQPTITAAEARRISERVSLVSNAGNVPHIYKLIAGTAALGFNKVIISIFPEMYELVIDSFPGYSIQVLHYKEPLYPDLLVILIIW